MEMGARYWRLHEAAQPGDVVAEHDGFQGEVPGAGPGNYRVIVRRPDRSTDTLWPIELRDSRDGTVLVRFNQGMARWFGLRLIEAATLDELREANLAGMQVSARWGEVQDWMHMHAADYLIDVPAGDSIVPALLRLLGDAKQILADRAYDDSVRS